MIIGADLQAPDHKLVMDSVLSFLCRVSIISLLLVLKTVSQPCELLICHRVFVSIAGETPGNPKSFA